MPISPLRMSVMRGTMSGNIQGFKPVEKEVYSMANKEKKHALGGRVITGTDKGSGDRPLGGKVSSSDKSNPANWKIKDDNAKPKETPKGNFKRIEHGFPNGPKKKPGEATKTPLKPPVKAYDFNSTAAGDKKYGISGRSAPNVGPVSNKAGYAKRDIKIAAAKKLKNGFGSK